MTWKLDLAIVILILGGLFAVYMMDFSSDVVEDTATTVETTILTTISTTIEATIETTTYQIVDTSIETTLETTVLEGKLFISGIELNGSTLTEEWVEITAFGSDYELVNYTLSDSASTPHTYTFPKFTLVAGSSVKVHTGIGNDTFTDLYWNRASAIWNNDGDTAILTNSADIVVDEKTCDNGTCWFTE